MYYPEVSLTQPHDASSLHGDSPSEASSAQLPPPTAQSPSPHQIPSPQLTLKSQTTSPSPQPLPRSSLPAHEHERFPTPDPERELSTPDTDDEVGHDTPLPPHLSAPLSSKEKSTPEIVRYATYSRCILLSFLSSSFNWLQSHISLE